MRCFIAIDIDDKIRKALGELQLQLQNKAAVKKGDVKWTRPEAIHLTLKFLGEIESEKAAGICDIVKKAANENKSFELAIETVGYFGGKSARVLWVGTGKGSDNLRRLQEELEQQLALVGWPEEEREFAGHLTLCRVRDSKAGIKLAQISENYKEYKLGTISADSISVYQSELKPAGPVYTLLGNYKLQ